MKITIQKYNDAFHSKWNHFLEHSINGSFFFSRNFIHYHKNRIVDHSLLFLNKKDQIIAILPAVEIGNQLNSHSGLSFGGLVHSDKYGSEISNEIFIGLKKYLLENKFDEFIYKAQPFFHLLNQDHSDHFNLLNLGATIIKTDVSFCISLSENFNPNKAKKRAIKKNKDHHGISDSIPLFDFYKLLSLHLEERYDTKPLHNFEDLEYLLNAFPENIKIFGTFVNGHLVASILVFVFKDVIKAQYICSNEQGFKYEGISILVEYLHDYYRNEYQYLDLGTSNDGPESLNFSLARFKESLGAIPKAILTYRLKI